MSVQKSLVSNLSDTLESKNLTIDERNLTSTQWMEYHNGTKRKSYNTLPASNITAVTGIVKLVSDDEEYITTLFHLIENEQNIYLSIEDAEEYVRKHEMNHFRHYRSRMSPYVSFANSLDGKMVCRINKLKNI